MKNQVITVELHCHTLYSVDGLMTMESLLRTAERVGLDALAVTDHNTIEGALEFQRYVRARNARLQVIVGEEKTLEDDSHFIGLFLQEPIQSRTLAGAIAEIKAQEGFCLVPHPFRNKDGLLRQGLEPLPVLVEAGAAFELFNAKCSHATNSRARMLLTSLKPFGGSDAHYESDVGECVNVLRWDGGLKQTIRGLVTGGTPLRILGKHQGEAAPERAYAPWYYRVRKHVPLVPRPLLPLAKQCYRRWRNLTHGVGPKRLVEQYARD